MCRVSQKRRKVVPGIELGLPESESDVLTITLYNHWWRAGALYNYINCDIHAVKLNGPADGRGDSPLGVFVKAGSSKGSNTTQKFRRTSSTPSIAPNQRSQVIGYRVLLCPPCATRSNVVVMRMCKEGETEIQGYDFFSSPYAKGCNACNCRDV